MDIGRVVTILIVISLLRFVRSSSRSLVDQPRTYLIFLHYFELARNAVLSKSILWLSVSARAYYTGTAGRADAVS